MLFDRDKLISRLQQHEGWSSTAYLDSQGYLTIGYGRLIDKKANGGISRDEGLFMLNNDINAKSKELEQAISWVVYLDDVRQAVLLEMAFNLGITGLLKFQKMLMAVSLGQWDVAAAEMLDSKWATQVKGRAVELSNMMKTGKYNEEE